MSIKKRQRITSSILILILTVLAVLLLGMAVYFINIATLLKQDIKEIQNRIDIISTTTNNTDQITYSQFTLISDNAKAEMDRLVTTVGVLATVYTIFGALIVFRAPHEIDKRIADLDNWVREAKESAENAKYLAEINEALTICTENEFTNYIKIKSITKIIDKYPDKPEAYIQRGFIYDRMEKYDEAIIDYRIARKKGYDDASIFSNIGVAYHNKKEYVKAERYYSQAIAKDSNDSAYFSNRGACYADMKRYNKALDDFTSALKIDPEERDVYINRALTYKSLQEEATSEAQKNDYHEKIIDDLKKALEIDPDHKKTKRLLEENSRDEKEFFEFASSFYEQIGDMNKDNPQKALMCYFEAFENKYLYNTEEIDNSTDVLYRLVNKIHSIARDDIDIEQVIEKTSKSEELCRGLNAIGIKAYEEGNHLIAEKAFMLLIEYIPESTSGYINLAYMKRRGETQIIQLSVNELISKVENDEKGDAILCVNKALCHVSNIDGFEQSFQAAIAEIDSITQNANQAIAWWSDIDIVGQKEHNMVMLLLEKSKYPFEIENEVSIEERIQAAQDAGYCITD